MRVASNVTVVLREILTHLAEHPEQADTAEGIAEWWLMDRYIATKLAEVRTALAELVRRDLVVERSGPDARVRYQVNQRRLDNVRSLLRELAS